MVDTRVAKIMFPAVLSRFQKKNSNMRYKLGCSAIDNTYFHLFNVEITVNINVLRAYPDETEKKDA
jgi:hypothetical protein